MTADRFTDGAALFLALAGLGIAALVFDGGRALRRRIRARRTARRRLAPIFSPNPARQARGSHRSVPPSEGESRGPVPPRAAVISAGAGSTPAGLPSRSVLPGDRVLRARRLVAGDPTQTVAVAVRGAGVVRSEPASAGSGRARNARTEPRRRGSAGTSGRSFLIAVPGAIPPRRRYSDPDVPGPALPTLPSGVRTPQLPPLPADRSGAGDGGRGDVRHPYTTTTRHLPGEGLVTGRFSDRRQ